MAGRWKVEQDSQGSWVKSLTRHSWSTDRQTKISTMCWKWTVAVNSLVLEAGNSMLAISEQWERCCHFPGPALVRWCEYVVYTVTVLMSICCSHHLDLTWMVLKPFVLVRSVIASQEGKLVCKIRAPRNKRYVYTTYKISAIFVNLSASELPHIQYFQSKIHKSQCSLESTMYVYLQKHKIHFCPNHTAKENGHGSSYSINHPLTSCWGILTRYIMDLQTCEELFNTLRWRCSSTASLRVSGR